MDLGLTGIQASIEHVQQDGDLDTFILKMKDAEVVFNQQADQVIKCSVYSDRLEQAVSNLTGTYAAIEHFGVDNAALHVINGMENHLCQIMGWEELPNIDEENKADVAAAVTEKLGEQIGRVIKKIWEFIMSIPKLLMNLIKTIIQWFKHTDKALQKEGARLSKITNPTPYGEVVVQWGGVTKHEVNGMETPREFINAATEWLGEENKDDEVVAHTTKLIETMADAKDATELKTLIIERFDEINSIDELEESISGGDSLFKWVQEKTTNPAVFEYHNESETAVTAAQLNLANKDDLVSDINDCSELINNYSKHLDELKDLIKTIDKLKKSTYSDMIKNDADAELNQSQDLLVKMLEQVKQSLMWKITETKTNVKTIIAVSEKILNISSKVEEAKI